MYTVFFLFPPRALTSLFRFHARGVATFSQNPRQKPPEGFLQLLPCAHDVIPLHDPVSPLDQSTHGSEMIVWNSTIAGKLGLSPSSQSGSSAGSGVSESEGRGAARGSGGEVRSFDVSVLCTAYMDLNVLLNPGHHELGARLLGPFLWNVNVSSKLCT